jgi:uncharacterized protein YodC (DUF2158 family)
MSKRKRLAPTTRFHIGDKVRVRHGVKDADFPDIPMGGWAGIVTEIHDDGMFAVRWSKETLASIHPVIKRRCEKDGLDLETYWLGADDLEPDTGGPVEIEQPKEIATKPLSPKDQDDRVRIVLGLTSNDPLSDVENEALAMYQEYLANNLTFPFTAEHSGKDGRRERVKVIGLGDPDDEAMIDETYGILCEARLEHRIVTLPLGELEDAQGKLNRRLIEDYCYWFWNWR